MVEFFGGSVLVGTATAAPYSVTLTNGVGHPNPHRPCDWQQRRDAHLGRGQHHRQRRTDRSAHRAARSQVKWEPAHLVAALKRQLAPLVEALVSVSVRAAELLI
jgi:hypothetical protein